MPTKINPMIIYHICLWLLCMNICKNLHSLWLNVSFFSACICKLFFLLLLHFLFLFILFFFVEILFLNWVKSYATDLLYIPKLVSINLRCCHRSFLLYSIFLLYSDYSNHFRAGVLKSTPRMLQTSKLSIGSCLWKKWKRRALSPMKYAITGTRNPAGLRLWGTGFGHPPLSKEIEIRHNSWTPPPVMISVDKGSGTCCYCWRPPHPKVSSSAQVNQWLILPRGLWLPS